MMKRGLALILVVGVLGVLAVLGSAFAVLSRLERRAASQRVHATRAYLLARSGIEDATARIDSGQDPVYGGENWDGDPNAALSALEAAEEVYRPTGTATSADVDACPVRHAMRPSFYVKYSPGNPDPALTGVDGKQRGYSGYLGTPRTGWSQKVTPPGGFCVNVGDPAVLRRMMGNLAEAIDREDGVNDAAPVDQADGFNLVDLRPVALWSSFAEIRDLALGGSQAKLDALQPYLALQAWVDKKVIRPQGDAAMAGVDLGGWSEMLLARPLPTFETRAPVDWAWARRRRPALIALMGGLSGMFVDERFAQGGLSWGTIGRQIQATLTLNWTLATDECRSTAALFLTTTSELSTWDQLNAYCDSLPMTGTTNLRQAKRELLKASFNPNSDLNKFGADASMGRYLDKSDLIPPYYSTELDFSPRRGGTVSCAGRILDGQGRVLASRTLSMTLSEDRRVRLSTQGELVAGDLGALDVAGDEASWRAYGDAPYIAPAGGSTKSFGHRIFGNLGMSLQTWPEPHTVPVPASWDGQLKLATVETETLTGTSMLFLASWASDLDADYSKGGSLQHVVTVPPPATHSLWSPVEPGMLRPDGIYEEGVGVTSGGLGVWDHTLAYPTAGSLAPTQGTISFWVKRGIYNALNNKGHVFFNNSQVAPRSPPIPPYNLSALFFIQNIGKYTTTGWKNAPFFYMENRLGDNQSEEIGVRLKDDRGLKHRRWQLLSCVWDMHVIGLGTQAMHLCLDRAQDLDDRSIAGYGPITQNSPTIGSSAVFHLSGDGDIPYEFNWDSYAFTGWGGADSTLDEFAIYDFGPFSVSLGATEALALSRFTQGRYYKESAYPDTGGLKTPLGIVSGRTAGEWFSAPLDLGECRIRSLSWTQIVPRELRAPAGVLPEDGDKGPDGRVLFELAHANVQIPYAGGDAYALDDAGREIPSLLRECRGETVARRVKAPFRLHAVFQPNLFDTPLGTKDNKAILDPLTLDDVTVSYRSVDQPMLSGWQEGE